ncbi:nucleoside triphosphate pyrophosphohydrolase [Alkalibacter saccharofermentans]|uniref:Predicted house-cleaning noncanonical NTP pyrophosphatase, all-alpha NTP-PPase (MazG) superfamily n=1 Tax=Alkalibacter saccharofermentans DSM 14828 TaxID=1120975 RepID=A0A1M4UCD7_9FIRM|nr:nucleoside triphosphate pyrophosphohydrolase [Alkalibacter saccharofermentans]SHE54521.1 Predicted house-cleaning noncanonical NTP pyrophosphatase, all-alpha NTP-PPase (MazG) superfamily [Alkalibacter saccharofermentans DSM 14828]
MKITYNKLIRDKIPELIEKSGRKHSVKELNEKEYHDALIDKIIEEIQEFRESDNEEELADIYEALECLVELKDYEPMHIDYLRLKKREAQGSFNKRLLLEEVEEEES